MPEVLEKPEGARRSHPRGLVIRDDRALWVHAPRCQQMADHPEKRRERRWVGVDQTDAIQIDVHSARDVPGGERLCGPEIEQHRWLGAGGEPLA